LELVFVVEGGTGVGRVAQRYLESAKFTVRLLSADRNVVQQAEQVRPAVIMIDALAAKGRGLELCTQARRSFPLARTALILLAVDASEEERIQGLELGADDYITGLQSAPELVARVQAVIRRFARALSWHGLSPLGTFPFLLPATGPIKTGDIEIDPSAMKFVVRGGEVEVTNLEFRLMYYLSFNRSRVFTRDELLDAVWGTQYASPRCVDACVRRLRRKIEPNLTKPTYLKTVRGAGYCLSA
jgi:two-component system alkaline phosphatase synthesis response regulator PhoP